MEDIPGMKDIVANTTVWDNVANDMSGRYGTLSGEKLNFAEWLFVRIVSVAWGIGSGSREKITRSELLDIAMKIIP